MSNFKVGIAQVEYTPQPGLPLMGNFRDDYAARGVHDRLFSRAVVFQNPQGQKTALCSVDVCMIDRGGVSMMREFIASQSDIPAENILVAATHTHSGPAMCNLGSLPKADEKDIETCLKKAAASVLSANENLKDSTLSLGCSKEARVSFNRRLKCKDGKTHMNWEKLDPDFVIEPLGPIDPQLIALFIEQEGRPAAALVNFGLHPAVLAGDNWLYSADYPGYLAEAMTRLAGPDFVTIFLNGCCGNVNHVDYSDTTQGRGYQMTQRIGYMLAVAVQEAMKNKAPVEGETLAVSTEKIGLERFKISQEQVKWSEDVLEKAKTNPTKGQEDGLPDEHFALTWLDMHRKQDTDDEVEVMAMRVGNLGIVGLPGEIFCEFGLDIKRQSPAKDTIVIELANDAIGYIPVQKAFEQGGYESMTGSTFYAKGSGEKLAASALNQLRKLFKNQVE